ncbi:MAG: S46 family peptidase [Desulfobacterales bacterium]|nr:S46 family peptidase [Desulfobacterales bacterium]
MNHHCAFGSVCRPQALPEHDYVTDGFLAKTRGEEIPARGQTVRLIESYKDVSGEVLSVVSDTMDLGARTRAINKKMSEIVSATEKAQTGRRAEVAEMFTGKELRPLRVFLHQGCAPGLCTATLDRRIRGRG